ncbi:unannotated protein [freshwater metagenome]|uniref:Unannotated protein n=1 Tax=freshwater metagenome TaxID=449393 RepID=A0A6J6CDJ6_9ZZZZ
MRKEALAVLIIEWQHDLTVRPGAEWVLRVLLPDALVAVDFAVAHDCRSLIRAIERLMTIRWVNDGQSGAAKHSVLKYCYSLLVGPTVIESRDHDLNAVNKRVCTCSDYSGNAAHRLLL